MAQIQLGGSNPPGPQAPPPSPPINTGTPLESVASDVYGAAYKNAEKFDRQTEEGIKKMEGEKLPSPPTLTESPKPENYHTDPLTTFGSPAMWLATFGSLLTKRPLENALSSGAAVFNARNSQDANAFKQAMEKWKVDTDNAWKMAEYNQQLYKDVIGRDEAELKARAVSAKDNVMMHMADAKMASQLYKDREKNLVKFKEAADAQDYAQGKMDEAAKAGKSPIEQQEIYFKALGSAKKEMAGKGESSGMSDGDYDTFKKDPKNIALADAYASGAAPAELVRGIGKGAGEKLDAIQRLAVDRHPDLDLAGAHVSYVGRQSESRALGTQTAKLATAGREADNLGDLLVEASAQVPRTNFPKANSALLAYEKGTGDPQVVAYGAALNSYINAYARAINPSGQARISDKDHAREMLSEAFSDTQVKAVVEQLKKETEQAREAPEFVKSMLRSSKEGSPKKGLSKEPSSKHIKMLQDNPSEEMKDYFDEAYGSGAAKEILGE